MPSIISVNSASGDASLAIFLAARHLNYRGSESVRRRVCERHSSPLLSLPASPLLQILLHEKSDKTDSDTDSTEFCQSIRAIMIILNPQ